MQDTERSAYESALQKLESDLRQKAKVPLTQEQFELSLQLSEAQKAISQLTATKEAICNTESKPDIPERRLELNIKEDKARGEWERLQRCVLDANNEVKRGKMAVSDLERKLKRTEAELEETRDALAEKCRESERWKKEYEIVCLTAKSRLFPLPAVFTDSRRIVPSRVASHSPMRPTTFRRIPSESILCPFTSLVLNSISPPPRLARSRKQHSSRHSLIEVKQSPRLRKRSVISYPSSLLGWS